MKSLQERMVIKYSDQKSVKVKDLKGRVWTVHTYAIPFRKYPIFSSETDNEGVTSTRAKYILSPLTIITITGDIADIAKRLSWVREGKCKITEDEVRRKLKDALDRGTYKAVAKRVVQIWFVINTDLEGVIEPNETSEWIIVGTPEVRALMSDEVKPYKITQKFLARRPVYEQELEEKIRKDIEAELEQKLEKSLLQKLKQKIKGDKK